MLIVLDMLLFVLLTAMLIAIIMQNDKNKKDVLKFQAYTCIGALSLEAIILIVRFMISKYWAVPLILLIVNAVLGVGIILEAKDYGAFEKKKKQTRVNDDVVV